MLSKKILSLSRNTKRMIVLLADLCLVPLALWASFSLRLGQFYWPEGNIIYLFAITPIISVPIFVRFGLYRSVMRYIGFQAMWAVAKAVSLYTLIWGVVVMLAAIPGVPRSVLLINWLMAILLIGGSRALARWWLAGNFSTSSRKAPKKKVLIYGAGDAGIQIASALAHSPRFSPVAFVDDNRALQGNQMGVLNV